MPQLRFSFSEFERELGAIRRIADDYIHHDFDYVIPHLLTALQVIRQTDGSRSYRWEIPDHSPLRTITSRGQFEPDRKGGRSVYGEVSSVWEIQAARDIGPRKGPAHTFHLVGNASTRLTIIEEPEEGPTQELAMWRMEIGGTSSPGACFHIQVLGQADRPPFPKYLPVPRLPTMMFTPMFAFDFLLGELFQDDWPRHVTTYSDRGDIEIWRSIQSERLKRVLEWQLEALGEGGATPWTWMKKLKPPASLFFGK